MLQNLKKKKKLQLESLRERVKTSKNFNSVAFTRFRKSPLKPDGLQRS